MENEFARAVGYCSPDFSRYRSCHLLCREKSVLCVQCKPIFDRLDDGTLTGVVSPITLAECLVLPYKLGKPNVAQVFTDLLVNSQNVLFCPVDETIADKAANLRARYDLTLTDAFQIATAIQAGCDSFLTNDVDLKRVMDIPILIVSE